MNRITTLAAYVLVFFIGIILIPYVSALEQFGK